MEYLYTDLLLVLLIVFATKVVILSSIYKVSVIVFVFQTKVVECSVKQPGDSKVSHPDLKNAHILDKGSRDYYKHLKIISDSEDSLKDLNDNPKVIR